MDHEYQYLSPYSASEQLQPVIKDLELSAVTQQLKDEGFAIVRDAVQPVRRQTLWDHWAYF